MTGRVIPHEVQGNGRERAILLHNWFGDRSSFDSMREHLNGEVFSYAFLDCRGYGESMDIDGAFTMEEAAQDALAVADHLGWETFSVIGHSMGAKAAQLMLLEAPSRIRSIVGISPVPASGFPLDQESWELFAGAAENPANRRAIIDYTTGGQHNAVWLDGMVRHSVERSSALAFRAYLDDWTRTDFHGSVIDNPVPVLVIAGAHDPALGPDAMEATWLQWYPNAELMVLEDSGHYAPEEEPQAVAAAVQRFLSRFAFSGVTR